MSCRSYTLCRSYNFDKIFAEVTTSTDNIVEVTVNDLINMKHKKINVIFSISILITIFNFIEIEGNLLNFF